MTMRNISPIFSHRGDSEEKAPEENAVAAIADEFEGIVQGFFRGRTGWREWRESLLTAIYARRFGIAVRIIQLILQNLGISQDVWIWRVCLVVMKNMELSDDVYHKLYRVIYFTKTTDYDERRLTLFYAMIGMKKSSMAIDYLEKDMPRKMRAIRKEMKTTYGTDYRRRLHAALQMWRVIVSFWKTDVVSESADIIFDRTLLMDTNDREKFDLSLLGERCTLLDEEKGSDHGGDDENADSEDEAPPEGEDAHPFMVAAGHDIMQSFNMDQKLEVFEHFLGFHADMDTFVWYYIQLAEAAEQIPRLQTTLEKYCEKNAKRPTAFQFLINFHMKYNAEDIGKRRPYLKKLVDLVPYGSHVTQLCLDIQDSDEDLSEGPQLLDMCKLVVHALDYQCHYSDEVLWQRLAKTVANIHTTKDKEVLSFLKQTWSSVRWYWDKLHFRPNRADAEDDRVVRHKVQVCWALYGKDHKYVTKSVKNFSAKSRRKLDKLSQALDRARQVLQSADEVSEEEVDNEPVEVPQSTSKQPIVQPTGRAFAQSAARPNAPPSKGLIDTEDDFSSTSESDAEDDKSKRSKDLDRSMTV
ncbi:hypothetical protein RvY_07121 [Ramazzottius varieornatus]|uniref:Uncharacterized protein n=1 Tax=Ramazzottius varieornatus TaxID=947166 RepID=A0A1D1VAH8_RAMVA|nr:hypothetical protein RvY_07121 [Ramazzottius varieornatus]